MSFLYKALLKESDKDGSKPDGTNFKEYADFHSDYSDESYAHSVTNSHWYWLVIVILIIAVSILAGYLYSERQVESRLNVQARKFEQQQLEAQQQIAQLKGSEQQRIIENLELENQVLQAKLEKQKQIAKKAEQQESVLEISVDEQGQVQANILPDNEVVPSINADDTQTEPPLEQELAELPEELKQRFAKAVAETANEQSLPLESNVEASSSLKTIDELSPAEQFHVPNVQYQMHIYASEPSERWVKVNNRELTEGQWLTANLQLVEIRQAEVIWQVNGRKFSQVAMEDYSK